MIHRALLGSIERFFGVLLEHYAGAFPPWLAPEQIRIVPVGDKFFDYAKKLEKIFKDAGMRVSCDLSDDRMNNKIRLAANMKIPYTVIVGEKEEAGNLVSVRYRGGKQVNGLEIQAFIDEVNEIVADKAQL